MKRFFIGLLFCLGVLASSQYYTGDGAKGLSLLVQEVKAQSTNEDSSWLAVYANQVLCDNIKRYSAITVMEGTCPFTTHLAQVSLIGKGDKYELSVAITKRGTQENKASFTSTCDQGTMQEVLGKCTASILGQLGVKLTDACQKELEAGQTQYMKAQELAAKAYVAQKRGDNMEAVRLNMQAARIDPTLSRNQTALSAAMNKISAQVKSGDYGEQVRDDIARRKVYLSNIEILKSILQEAKDYYAQHPPYTLVYDKPQVGTKGVARSGLRKRDIRNRYKSCFCDE